MGSSLTILSAQNQAYFQQTVNYDIDVTLDDNLHQISGTIDIEYTNNSPDELTFIYFHLWPNAYQYNTALAKQLVEDGSLRMYFAEEKQLGNIRNLNFKADGQTLSWENYNDQADIAIVRLNEPLKSGKTITISTPFTVKIPNSFSRLGHVKTSYQMTQWYPKPAVYDRNGWHPMPYLNMGEFYSEFGAFDVKITLPKNYVVGATGELQTESEKAFLAEKVKMTDAAIKADTFAKKSPFPISSSKMKTLRYTAENVHDFAWFADKRFYVQKGEVTLASGKKVDTWAMFTDREANLWKRGVEYLNRSVKYYSDRIGEYPYPHATAVQSALSAGAGMEYPMITVIGRSGDAYSLDQVITHEVGHNWFYGILATNERDYAWMDEGMNSYYETAYMRVNYEKLEGLDDYLPKQIVNVLDVKDIRLEQAAYQFQARRGEHQPLNTVSEELTNVNYGIGAYTTPSLLFEQLENYLGTAVFDKAIQAYYNQWKFKHPQPIDLRNVLEKETGKKLDWMFEFIDTKKVIDYAIGKVEQTQNGTQITVKNKGEIAAPFSISVLDESDKIIETVWYDGFYDEEIITFPAKGEIFMIDAVQAIPEFNRTNNRHPSKTGLRFLTSFENPKQKSLYYLPLLSYNQYDGFMAGLAFYNGGLPAKNFEFALAPMYGFGSSDVVGLADVKYNWYLNDGAFKRITLGVNYRRFHDFESENFGYKTVYNRIQPKLTLEFDKAPRSKQTQEVYLKTQYITSEDGAFSPVGDFIGTETDTRLTYGAGYIIKNTRQLFPYDLSVDLLGESYEDGFGRSQSYLKASLEANYEATFGRGQKSFDMRLFIGSFLSNSNTDFGPFPFALAAQGYNDFTYDEYYFGRSEQTNIWSQQVALSQGGFKAPLQRGAQTGTSNSFVIAFNFKTDLPMRLPLGIPLKPYFDIGYARETAPSVTDPVELYYSGGVMLDIGDGIFGIYLPLFNSEQIETNFDSRGSFAKRISFSLDLNRLNPFELIRTISF